MAATSQRLQPDFDPQQELTASDRTRDFLLIDCAVWISRIVSAAQRNDAQGVTVGCQTLLGTVSMLGASASLKAAEQLESACESVCHAEMLWMSTRLVRDTILLVNDLKDNVGLGVRRRDVEANAEPWTESCRQPPGFRRLPG